eukprot:276689-Rhodomonas_salina.1
MQYSYLWTSDINEVFDKFLKGEDPPENHKWAALAEGEAIPALTAFEEQIMKYKQEGCCCHNGDGGGGHDDTMMMTTTTTTMTIMVMMMMMMMMMMSSLPNQLEVEWRSESGCLASGVQAQRKRVRCGRWRSKSKSFRAARSSAG